jgi:dolichyl-phosphate-mannose--protein O-mannosyl transferase
MSKQWSARSRIGWAAPLVMTLAVVTRIPGLGQPGVLVFDEQYYAPGAAEMLQWGAVHGLAKHPPLGWWLIASGIELFGFTPTGWRVASLVAGVATVGAVCAATRRLTGDQWLAFAAGTLCALDGVMFTTGRLGMLDSFVGLFVALTVWALAVAWTTPNADDRSRRRAHILALVAAGLGSSVKWSVAPLVVVVLGSMLATDWKLPRVDRRRAMVLSIVVAVAIPAGLYALAWAPRQVGPAAFTPSTFLRDQRSVLKFHTGLEARNSNAAPATTWFAIERPARLFAQDCSNPAARRGAGPCHGVAPDSGVLLLALPNPLTWAVCLAGLAGLLWRLVRRRRTIGIGLLAVVATQWGPWIFNRRWAYSFYLTAIIPTLIVAAAWLIGPKRARRLRLPLVGVMVVTVGLFVFFYPVWTGRVLPNSELGQRIWWWGWAS